MEDYNDPIREAIEAAIMDEVNGLALLKIGSTERKNSVDSLSILLKGYHEDCRLGGQLMKEQEEIDLAKRRFLEETNRAERDLEMREANSEKAAKWYNQPIVEKVMICGTSIGTLAICMIVNSGMSPLKSTLDKFVYFVKPKI